MALILHFGKKGFVWPEFMHSGETGLDVSLYRNPTALSYCGGVYERILYLFCK
jgi:hypothetical protein